MDDETTTDEEAGAEVAEEEAALADPEPDADAVEDAKRAALEPPEPHPEPTPVGHGIVQDNVSQPGHQVTSTAEGEPLGDHSYADAHAPAEAAEA